VGYVFGSAFGPVFPHELQRYGTDAINLHGYMEQHKGCVEIKLELLMFLNMCCTQLNVHKKTFFHQYSSGAITALFKSCQQQIKVIFSAEGSSLKKRGGIDLCDSFGLHPD